MVYRAIGFDYYGVISDGHLVDSQILDLIDSLRKNGYKVGLLSNYGKSGAQEMRRLGIDRHFDAFHVSGETGLAKPSSEAFMKLAKSLGVELSELIFIDDSPYCLSSSSETGFTPILYSNKEQLIKELDGLGVNLQR